MGGRRARQALVALPVLPLGCWGLFRLARDDDLDTGMLLVVLAHVVLGVLAFALAGPRDLREGTPSPLRGLAALVLPTLLVELVVGLAAWPATFEEGMSRDSSWFLVVPAVVLVVGGGTTVLTIAAGVLVVVPVLMIVRGIVGRRGRDPRAAESVVLGLLVLWVVPTAVALAVGTGHGARRGGLLDATAFLLGIRSGEQPGWLWVSRLLVLGFVVLLLLARTLTRRQKPTARTGSGDGPGPRT